MKNIIQGLICLTLIFFSTSDAISQLNVFSGFSGSSLYTAPLEQAIEDYNEQRPWLSSPMNNLNSMIGLQLGLRYRIESIGFSTGIHYRVKKIEATGQSTQIGNFQERFNFNTSTFHLGTEIFLAPIPISLGGSFGYDILNVNHTKTDVSNKKSILRTNNWSSHFFLALNFGDNTTTKLSLRPFWDIVWRDNDFSILFASLESKPLETNVRLSSFGLSLIILNGN